MMKIYRRKKYEAFSLVEMLITTVLLGFIMLISALVLTTLIKVSTTSTNKARVRTDSEYVLELLKRTIRTTDPNFVKIYNSSERKYDANTGFVSSGDFEEIDTIGVTGNEIHIRPNNSQRWICLAYYKGVNTDKDNAGNIKGYILKTSMMDIGDTKEDHSKCFVPSENPSYNYMILNSRFVNIEEFKIQQKPTVDFNKIIQFDLKASAINWYFGNGSVLSRSLYRQAIVKTESVIW
jgi:Tfp pilus assembly protein PilW